MVAIALILFQTLTLGILGYKIISTKFKFYSFINILLLFQIIIHHTIPFILNYFFEIDFYKDISNKYEENLIILVICSIFFLLSYLVINLKNKNQHFYMNKNIICRIDLTNLLQKIIIFYSLLQILIFIGIIPFPFLKIDEHTKNYYSLLYDYWPYYNPILLESVENKFLKYAFISFWYITIPFGLFILTNLLNKKISLYIILFLIFILFLSVSQRSVILGIILPTIILLYISKKINMNKLLFMSFFLLLVYIATPILRDNSTQNYTNSFIERASIQINSITKTACNIFKYKDNTNNECAFINIESANNSLFIEKIKKKISTKNNPFLYIFSQRTDANLFGGLFKNEEKEYKSFNNIEFIKINLKYLLPNFLYDKSKTLRVEGYFHEYYLADPSSYILITTNSKPTDFIRSFIIDTYLISDNIYLYALIIFLFIYLINKFEILFIKKDIKILHLFIFITMFNSLLLDFNITSLLVAIRNSFILYIALILINKCIVYFNLKIDK